MLIHIIKVLICGSVVISIFAWVAIRAIRVHDEEESRRARALARFLRSEV